MINAIEKLLTSLNFDRKTIELGKIAGLLHDIGTIDGKKGITIPIKASSYFGCKCIFQLNGNIIDLA